MHLLKFMSFKCIAEKVWYLSLFLLCVPETLTALLHGKTCTGHLLEPSNTWNKPVMSIL